MARVFAVMAQILLRAGAIAVQFPMEPGFSHGTGLCSKAQAQYHGTNLIGERISHGSVILLTAAERIRVRAQKY